MAQLDDKYIELMRQQVIYNELMQKMQLAKIHQNSLSQLGAQPHGRYWPPPQALHGSSAGVPGSGAGGRAGGPITRAFTSVRPPWAEPEPAPPTIEEAGIRAGEIVAWRVWRLEPREKIVPKTPLRPLPHVSRDRLALAKYETESVPATPLLRSTYKRTIWEPGQTMEAHADPTTQGYDDTTRANVAYVGIFAWKTLGQLCGYIQRQFSIAPNDPFYGLKQPEHKGRLLVSGQVILWGSVIEHEHGYRAQFAKPHRLFMVCDAEGYRLNEDLRVELCQLYGLPESGT